MLVYIPYMDPMGNAFRTDIITKIITGKKKAAHTFFSIFLDLPNTI